MFRYTSAKESVGINDLFACLGCKYLDPNFIDDGINKPRTSLDEGNSVKKEDNIERNRIDSFKLKKEKPKEKKKRFC